MKRVSTKDVRDLELWLLGRSEQELEVYKYKMKRNLQLGAAEAMGKNRAFEEALAKLRDTFAIQGGE